MTEARAAGGGLFGSMRRLGGTLLESAELRLELLGTEVEREKLRIGRALWLAAAGLLLAAVALLLLSLALVLLADPALRVAVLLALGVLYLLSAAGLLCGARAVPRTPGEGAFALSRAELRRDREALHAPVP